MPRASLSCPKLFTQQNVVTGSRSIDTVFQNTTGKQMFVGVTNEIKNVTGIAAMILKEGPVSPPTIAISSCNSDNTVSSIWYAMFGSIEPNFFYEDATANAGQSYTLKKWTEWS